MVLTEVMVLAAGIVLADGASVAGKDLEAGKVLADGVSTAGISAGVEDGTSGCCGWF